MGSIIDDKKFIDLESLSYYNSCLWDKITTFKVSNSDIDSLFDNTTIEPDTVIHYHDICGNWMLTNEPNTAYLVFNEDNTFALYESYNNSPNYRTTYGTYEITHLPNYGNGCILDITYTYPEYGKANDIKTIKLVNDTTLILHYDSGGYEMSYQKIDKIPDNII